MVPWNLPTRSPGLDGPRLHRLGSEMTRVPAWQGTWVVLSYRSGEEMVIADERTEARLTFDGSLVTGSMGVNRFSGQLDAQFPIEALVTTSMAGPPELMRQEDTLLEHLQEADTIDVIGDGMTMSLDGLLLVELERTGTGISDLPS